MAEEVEWISLETYLLWGYPPTIVHEDAEKDIAKSIYPNAIYEIFLIRTSESVQRKEAAYFLKAPSGIEENLRNLRYKNRNISVIAGHNKSMQIAALLGLKVPDIIAEQFCQFYNRTFKCSTIRKITKRKADSRLQLQSNCSNSNMTKSIDCPDSPIPEMRDRSSSVGTITEAVGLEPSEPGSGVAMLEGIVCQETKSGLLLVNAKWRGKSYFGTLADSTKHSFIPPTSCESSDTDALRQSPINPMYKINKERPDKYTLLPDKYKCLSPVSDCIASSLKPTIMVEPTKDKNKTKQESEDKVGEKLPFYLTLGKLGMNPNQCEAPSCSSTASLPNATYSTLPSFISDLKKMSVYNVIENKRRPPLPDKTIIDFSTPSSASSATLKEKHNNKRIQEENIKLKLQIDNKNKNNHHEKAMTKKQYSEYTQKYFIEQERIFNEQLLKLKKGIHMPQNVECHSQILTSNSHSSSKPHKNELSGSICSHSKSNHHGDNTKPYVVSLPNFGNIKNSHSSTTSSPKGNRVLK